MEAAVASILPTRPVPSGMKTLPARAEEIDRPGFARALEQAQQPEDKPRADDERRQDGDRRTERGGDEERRAGAPRAAHGRRTHGARRVDNAHRADSDRRASDEASADDAAPSREVASQTSEASQVTAGSDDESEAPPSESLGQIVACTPDNLQEPPPPVVPQTPLELLAQSDRGALTEKGQGPVETSPITLDTPKPDPETRLQNVVAAVKAAPSAAAGPSAPTTEPAAVANAGGPSQRMKIADVIKGVRAARAQAPAAAGSAPTAATPTATASSPVARTAEVVASATERPWANDATTPQPLAVQAPAAQGTTDLALAPPKADAPAPLQADVPVTIPVTLSVQDASTEPTHVAVASPNRDGIAIKASTAGQPRSATSPRGHVEAATVKQASGQQPLPESAKADVQTTASLKPDGRLEMAEPLTRAITKLLPPPTTGNRQRVIEMRLDPPTLGSIKVRVEEREGAVHATFVVPSARVERLVNNEMAKLSETLAQQGISLGSTTVQTGTGGGQPDHQAQREALLTAAAHRRDNPSPTPSPQALTAAPTRPERVPAGRVNVRI